MAPPGIFNVHTAVAWLSLFCDYLLLTAVIPLFPLLHQSDMWTGVLFTSKAAMQVIFAPMFGRFIDRWGLKLLMYGLIVSCVANMAFAYHVNYTTWLVGRMAQGVSSAAVIPCAQGHVQRVYRGDEPLRVRAFGLVISGILAGVVMGPPIGGVLFEYHPAAPFLLMSALLVIAIFLAHAAMNSGDPWASPVSSPAHSTGKGSADSLAPASVGDMAKDSLVMVNMGALFVANAAIASLEATFGTFGMKELGLSVAGVGMAYMWTTIPTILAGAFLGPWLCNHSGMQRWQIVMIGVVIQGVFFAMPPKTNHMVVQLCMLGLGVGMGIIDSVCPAINSQLADMRHGGSTAVHSLSTTMIQSGFIAGPLLSSYLVSIYGFGGMSLVLGGIMLLYAPCLAHLRQFKGDDAATDAEAQPLNPEEKAKAKSSCCGGCPKDKGEKAV